MTPDTIPFSQRLTVKSIAKYAILPGILPRLKNLGLSFSKIMFVFIHILGTTGLIDRNHPCLRSENIGRYSLSEVLLMAWQNVKFDRQHIPQTVMFFAVCAAILMLVGIFISACGYLFAGYTTVAHAQYFSMPNNTGIPYEAKNDWAFNYLENVFGGKYQTGIDFWILNDTGKGVSPWYTAIFTGMLKVYSQALLWIATFMILYILLTAVVEASRTGKPFGEQFDPIWAPIRFTIAIGLLLPVSGTGYNGAQMLVFQSAEWGSNLATNLWHRGVSVQAKDARNFIATSVSDPGYRFVRDVFLINLCVTTFNELITQKKISGYDKEIERTGKVDESGKTITISFGNSDSPDFCGKIVLPNPDEYKDVPKEYAHSGQSGNEFNIAKTTFLPTAMAQNFSNAANAFLPGTPANIMKETTDTLGSHFFCTRDENLTEMECGSKAGTFNCTKSVEKWIYAYWKMALGRDVEKPDQDFFMASYQDSLNAYNGWLFEGLKKDAGYGWASAGSFYLRMSYALSTLDEIVNNQPRVEKLPTNYYRWYATPEDESSNEEAKIKCGMEKGDSLCSKLKGPYLLSEILRRGAEWFEAAPKLSNDKVDNSAFYRKVNPAIWDSSLKMVDHESMGSATMGDVMGPMSQMIYDWTKISSTLNPLGQVIGWGSKLIYTSEVMFTLSIVFGFVSNFAFWGSSVLGAMSTVLMAVAKIIIVPGFILMFIVPLLPFMYFTFAVIEWIASIVEAVIGLPLWALTFITGEGNLGDGAKEGAGMLFEIVLRPTIIVMSLIASVIIFTASAGFFTQAMQSYMENSTNGSGTTAWIANRISGFGMIIVYMITIYTIAVACFKMIDAIPNSFGRWIGIGGGFGSIADMTKVGGQVSMASAYIANQAAQQAGDFALGRAMKAGGAARGVYDQEMHRREMIRKSYDALGLKPGATVSEIEAAYLAKSTLYNSDNFLLQDSYVRSSDPAQDRRNREDFLRNTLNLPINASPQDIARAIDARQRHAALKVGLPANATRQQIQTEADSKRKMVDFAKDHLLSL